MRPTSNALAVIWWAAYTGIGVWFHRTIPGIDFFCPGIILSLQEQSYQRTAVLALVWILLIEGAGNLPFGYGLAWYSLLAAMFFMGRWLFEARSFLFMILLGLGLGVLHPTLIYGLAALANLEIPLGPLLQEGAMQAAAFPIIWFLSDTLFPKRLRQDVKPL